MADNLQQAIGLKTFDASTAERSVIDTPSIRENMRPAGPVVFSVATAADEFIPWGHNLKGRDRQLRSFWPTEPILASAVFAMSARLGVTQFEIEGADPTKPSPKNTKSAIERMLANADYGQGWMSFVGKLAVDIYTQDNGAFIELVRKEPSPNSPVIAINHLDSYRCHRTGDPEIPVYYEDRRGRLHQMYWWNVVPLVEMPSPIESMFGAQYCAVTRALRAAQIIRDIAVYKKEKVSGQFMRGIHFVNGVSEDNITSALTIAKENQLNQNLMRYTQPVIMPTLDPETGLQHVQIDLATLPDNFDEEVSYKWYISQLALAFGVDYQEFAPLPGGTLGSSQQSEILHLKSRGKGPALLMARLEHVFNNYGILPNNVKFGFKVQDSRAESERALARFERGKDRAARVAARELDEEGARQLAILDGDLPEYLAGDIAKRQEELKAEQEAKAQEQLDQQKQLQEQKMAKQPITVTNDQVQGGIKKNMKSYSNDDLRAAAIQRLIKREGLVAEDVQITPEDIKAQKRRIAKHLLNNKEMTELGPVRRLGDSLESRIHQSFTLEADDLLDRGIINREERISLSAAIGNALKAFGDFIDSKLRGRPLDVPNYYGDPDPLLEILREMDKDE